MDTGTGQVHIAPGHGADDYIAGQQHGLPILSPVDDHGQIHRGSRRARSGSGKYVFDANADVVAHLRENGALLAEQKYTHELPALLALEDADRLPRGRAVLHPRSTPSAPRRSRRSTA